VFSISRPTDIWLNIIASESAGKQINVIEDKQIIKDRQLLEKYIHQIQMWANAYDQEEIERSQEEIDRLYDDAYKKVMENENHLP
jgi:hypothetical protein